MTSLRQRMTEDMQIRNLAVNTQDDLRPPGLTIRAPLQQVPRTVGT